MMRSRHAKTLRTIPFLIAACLIGLPANAQYSGGTGEPNDPYQIATAADLIALGETPADYDKHFLLTADIDLDPNLPGRKVFDKALVAPDSDFARAGFQGTAFTGVFDGAGHTISHLTIRGRSHLGLFGHLTYEAEVKSLRLENVNITGSDCYIGGLAGLNGGTVTQCCSAGVVDGNEDVGGLVGFNCGNVTHCYSTGLVSGAGDLVGGLVGENDRGNVVRCYSMASVVGDRNVGGLVGWNVAHCNLTCWAGEIVQCYSAGSVRGNSSVGGLVGDDIGGFVRRCFWDIQTSGQASSAGGTGKTTAEMRDPNTFIAADWDFAPHDIWFEPKGGGYPILWWQLSPWPSLPRFAGGTGEPNDPCVIAAPEELNRIGHNPRLMECCFKLADDLDLGGVYFFPIGNPEYAYRGVFDGGGHTISHLTIEGDRYLGLFGVLASEAEVRDLGVVDIEIGGSGYYIGGLVAQNGGCVSRCWSTGSVHGENHIGGLVGKNLKSGEVVGCCSAGQVDGIGYNGHLSGGDPGGVGGLVGTNLGTVDECCSAGVVDGRWSVGGLIGLNSANVTQSYSRGSVSGSWLAGGLVGNNGGILTGCYSSGAVNGTEDVGGLVGTKSSDAETTSSFWDTETSGQATSAGGTSKTTAEMQTASTFLDAGWDFMDETANGTEDIWWILEGQDYPRLWWELDN